MRDAIEQGIYLAPEDRKRSGLFLDFSIVKNITLPDLYRFATALLLDGRREHDAAETQSVRLAIKAPNVDTLAGEEAARFSGIPTDLVITSTYAITGLLTGISAVLFVFYTESVSPSAHGNFYELYAIAAAVLGGCSLRGGEGSILGIVLGTVLLQVLQNLVNISVSQARSISQSWEPLFS